MKHLLIPALLAALLAGCGTDPTAPGADVETRGNPGAQTGRIPTVTPESADGSGLPSVLIDPKSALSKRSVYFDLDQYDVKDEYKGLVAEHAKFLVNNRQFKMLVQGNTDERGSHEYNLSLGQKRADAVKRSLLLLGAREDQIESVSLGEEKPKAEGHDESAWTQNRRADILYKGPTGKGEF